MYGAESMMDTAGLHSPVELQVTALRPSSMTASPAPLWLSSRWVLQLRRQSKVTNDTILPRFDGENILMVPDMLIGKQPLSHLTVLRTRGGLKSMREETIFGEQYGISSSVTRFPTITRSTIANYHPFSHKIFQSLLAWVYLDIGATCRL